MGDEQSRVDTEPASGVIKSEVIKGNEGKGTLASPAEAFAYKVSDSLEKKYPQLWGKVAYVKSRQNWDGVYELVRQCPVYYLKQLGCYYQGQWLDKLPHGCGVAVYHNQSYYEGDFRRGQIETEEGLFFFNNERHIVPEVQPARQSDEVHGSDMSDRRKPIPNKSTFYKGAFSGSKFMGQGKIYHKGVYYEGGWFEGKRSGDGKQYSFEFDYTFTGQFLNGFKQGKGAYKRKIKEKVFEYQGDFSQGRFHGEGKILHNGMLHSEGIFAEGKIEGKGRMVFDQGKYQGEFLRGAINGFGVFIFSDSTRDDVEGSFRQQLVGENNDRLRVYCDIEFVTEEAYLPFPVLLHDS